MSKATVFSKSRKGISPSYHSQSAHAARLDLPELSEVDVIRHYTGLSLENHGVDNGSYPLGSCTMKYNPKRNDVAAELTGFRDTHPEQPEESLNGLWKLMFHLQSYIAEITGMDAVSLQPAAGAHGELAGLLVIHRYLQQQRENRSVILVADSAHGTNLASAAMAGFSCKIIPTTAEGLMDVQALEAALDDNVAALMLTNPSTLGLFEKNIMQIAKMVHENGSLLYYDGANLNALIGLVQPGAMGFDVVHINTHKTLSTPHGGGGPGAGPVGVKEFLAPYLPAPIIRSIGEDCYRPDHMPAHSIGRLKSYFGHTDVLIRAYAYLLTIGREALHEVSQDAVLNANYMQAALKAYLPQVYPGFAMHECLLSADHMPISAYDLAKRLIDYEVHPPTLLGAGCVYFPGKLQSAMLIEPTESESKVSLDRMIDVFKIVIGEANENEALVKNAPHSTKVSKIIMKGD